jgi:hypothetical protein
MNLHNIGIRRDEMPPIPPAQEGNAARIIWGRNDTHAIIAMTARLMMEMSADETRRHH